MNNFDYDERYLFTTEGNQWLEGSYGFFGNTKDDIKFAVKNYGYYVKLKKVGIKSFQCADDGTWYTYFYLVQDKNGDFVALQKKNA